MGSMTKSEIEKELEDKGDFVKIDRLTGFLKEPLSMDLKKFVYLKLAEIYERINMLNEAAKMYSNMASISITFSEKIHHLVKETELYIRSGAFDKAEESMKRANAQANSREKEEIYFTVKDFYKKQAEICERELKRNNAARTYEKLLEMNLNEQERKEIKEKLLVLYDKLGKRKEYDALEKKEF